MEVLLRSFRANWPSTKQGMNAFWVQIGRLPGYVVRMATGLAIVVGVLIGQVSGDEISVTNTLSSGTGSLPYAVSHVSSGGDVVFTSDIVGETISLNSLTIPRSMNFINSSGGGVTVNFTPSLLVNNPVEVYAGSVFSMEAGLTFSHVTTIDLPVSKLITGADFGPMAGALNIEALNTQAISSSANITFNNGFSGNITAVGSLFNCYGIHASTGIQSNDDFGGTISCSSPYGDAYGAYTAFGAIHVGGFSSTVTSQGLNACGVYSTGSTEIQGAYSGSMTSTAESNAYGFHALDNFTVSDGFSGTITATSTGGSGHAYGIHSGGHINGGDSSTPLVIASGANIEAVSPHVAHAVHGSILNLKVEDGATLSAVGGTDHSYAIYSGGLFSDQAELVAGCSIVGDIDLGLESDTLTLSGSSGSTTYEGNIYRTEAINVTGGIWDIRGTINDSAVVTQTGGTLSLDGSSYANPVQMNSGKLLVNGTLTTDLTVNANTILGGHGVLANLNNQGVVAPGNSIGTLTVSGDYTHAAGGTLEIEINNAGQSDKLAVSGSAVIQGGTVSVMAEGGTYHEGDSYTFLTAADVTGTFDSIIDDLAFFDASLVYELNYIQILISRSSTNYDAEAATFNQHGVARYLDAHSSGATGDFATVLDQLNTLTGPEARMAFDQMSGEVYGSLSTLGIENHEVFTRLISQRLQARHMLRGLGYTMNDGHDGLRSGDILYASNCGSKCTKPCGCRWTPWFEAYGVAGRLAGDGNAQGMTYSTGGLALGLERQLSPCALLGFAGGYSSSYTTLDDYLSDRGSIDSGQAALYLHRDFGGFYTSGIAAYGYNGYDTRRRIHFGTIDRVADANYGGNTYSFSLEVGRNIFRQRFNLQPYGALESIQLHQNEFVENGADSMNLAVDGITANAFRSLLGTRFVLEYLFDDDRLLTVSGRAVWRHEFLNENRIIDATFVGPAGPAFAIAGINVDRDAGIVGVGLSSRLFSGLTIFANYDALVSDNYTAHAGSGGFQYLW